jgi:hypothetical protein
MGETGQNYVAYIAAQNFPVKSVLMPSLGIDWFSPMSLAQFVGAAAGASSQPANGGPENGKND